MEVKWILSLNPRNIIFLAYHLKSPSPFMSQLAELGNQVTHKISFGNILNLSTPVNIPFKYIWISYNLTENLCPFYFLCNYIRTKKKSKLKTTWALKLKGHMLTYEVQDNVMYSANPQGSGKSVSILCVCQLGLFLRGALLFSLICF